MTAPSSSFIVAAGSWEQLPEPRLVLDPLGNRRSALWPKVRAAFLREHPVCAACGVSKDLELHHVRPYHLHPELELDFANLITLCDYAGRGCHFCLGHLYDWRRWNPHVREDADWFWRRMKESIALLKAG